MIFFTIFCIFSFLSSCTSPQSTILLQSGDVVSSCFLRRYCAHYLLYQTLVANRFPKWLFFVAIVYRSFSDGTKLFPFSTLRFLWITSPYPQGRKLLSNPWIFNRRAYLILWFLFAEQFFQRISLICLQIFFFVSVSPCPNVLKGLSLVFFSYCSSVLIAIACVTEIF
jgi:hypothetical protein